MTGKQKNTAAVKYPADSILQRERSFCFHSDSFRESYSVVTWYPAGFELTGACKMLYYSITL